MRALDRWTGWFGELRLAARSLWRSPGYTLAAVSILALGLGASVAIFSVFDAVVLRALPFDDAKRLVRIYAVPAAGTPRLSPHAATVIALAEHANEIGALAGQRYNDLTLLADAGPERLVGIGVTAGWQRTLGVHPVLGRGFTSDEERQGRASGVLLLSYGAWRSRFGGDPGVLGRVLPLAEGPMTVVGVMPPGLSFPYETEVWFPLDPVRDARGPWGFNLIGRRGPDRTLDQINQRLAAWTPSIARQVGSELEGLTLRAVPLREVVSEGEQGRLAALLAGVGFLLALVCANVAGLMLTRAGERRQEMAVRAALGAGLVQRLRPAMAEAVLISLAASAFGAMVVLSARSWLEPLMPGTLRTVLGELPLDGRAALFALGVGALVASICAVVPVVVAARSDVAGALVSASRGATRSRSRRTTSRVLVVAELALALMLCYGAALSLDELVRRSRTQLGYDGDGLVTLTAALTDPKYADGAARRRFVTEALERVERLPGIAAAGVTTTFPSPRGNTLAELAVEGREAPPDGERRLINHRLVSFGFLGALGVPMLEGRSFSQADRADRLPVVVVSRSLARRYFPRGDALGSRVRNLREPGPPRWLTIVGVVGDVHEYWDATDTWYMPYEQHADARNATEVTFVVRSGVETGALVTAMRRAVATVDPALALFDAVTPAQLLTEDLTLERTAARLAGLFGLVGLAVSTLGLYALFAFEVQRRRRELGIRMALGGSPTRLAWTFVASAARLVGGGLVLGLVLVIVASRLFGGLLPAPAERGLLAIAVPLAALAMAGLAGSLVPTLRARRLDPAETLRGVD